MQRSPDQFLFYLYLLFILCLPLPFGGDWPWALAMYEVMTFVMSALWLWLYSRNQLEFTVPFIKAVPVYLIFLIWLAYIGLQLMPGAGLSTVPTLDTLTVSPHLTFSGWMMSLAYVQIFFLTLVLVNTRDRIKQLAGVIVFCGVAEAMFGSLMTLSGLEYSFFVKKITYIGQATGTFYNRNHYAAYLVMCLSVGIGLMISRLDTTTAANWKQYLLRWVELIFSPKLRLRLYLIIMVIALVLTHSRMGNAAFFISLFISGGIGLVLSRHATRGTVILLTSLIIIDLFIVGAWFGVDKVAERLESSTVEGEERTSINTLAYQQWQDHFWLGTGLGTFPKVFPQYRDSTITSFYKQAHNDYLQFATETGLVGVLLLAAIVIPSLLMAILAQYKRRDPLMRGMSFAAMMGVIAILIHATVEFNFQIPPNAAMFVVLLGLSWISRFHSEADLPA